MENRIVCKTLGVVIGTMSSWDQPGDWTVLFYNVELNELGKQFLPEIGGAARDIAINFESGAVETYSDCGTPTIHETNWAVFNK